MELYQEIERSIIKKFRKDIWSKFMKAVIEYQLIQENDHIMVCISGGKDSFLLAKCIQELQRHGKVPFQAFYVVMDPGYREENRQLILENAKKMNLPIEIFQSDIFEIVDQQEKSPCYLCARMRRGCLYQYAKDLGCNKIALGHHMDDVIETTLLSMFYGAEIKTMMPKLHSENFKRLELIRPLYLVLEKDILAWKNFHHLTFLNCACRFTEKNSHSDELTSKRLEIKHFIDQLRKETPIIDHHIFKALDNVNLNCILGTRKDGEYHSFLEEYSNHKEDDFMNREYLSKEVKVVVDRPLGSKHPKHGFYYPVNYGYVPGTVSGDGEELDCYLLGVFDPVLEYVGECIAIIHRTNDDDDKLVVVPKGKNYTNEQIDALVEFQEKYFEHVILR